MDIEGSVPVAFLFKMKMYVNSTWNDTIKRKVFSLKYVLKHKIAAVRLRYNRCLLVNPVAHELFISHTYQPSSVFLIQWSRLSFQTTCYWIMKFVFYQQKNKEVSENVK